LLSQIGVGQKLYCPSRVSSGCSRWHHSHNWQSHLQQNLQRGALQPNDRHQFSSGVLCARSCCCVPATTPASYSGFLSHMTMIPLRGVTPYHECNMTAFVQRGSCHSFSMGFAMHASRFLDMMAMVFTMMVHQRVCSGPVVCGSRLC